jgi:hypothetical protein
MSRHRVIVVHLRQPRRSDPNESRADPFYEFGSFGCTKCHARNLMHPRRAHELEGARFAFAQGGRLGFRLVLLTPPAMVVHHADRCELTWAPAMMPFRYSLAPLLVDRDGGSDFPGLVGMLGGILRDTWPARFSSAFRSRRHALPSEVATEMCRVFDRARAKGVSDQFAVSYVDALPFPPNRPDTDRAGSLAALRNRGGARSRRRSGTRRFPDTRSVPSPRC